MSCKDFLATTADALCVSQFLQSLPGPIRQSLAGAVTIMNTISQAEGFLSSEADKLLDKAVDMADEKVTAALMPLQPLFGLADQVAPYVSNFSTCATVGTIVNSVLAPILQAENAVRNSNWRKGKMKEAAVAGASILTRTIFEAASAASPFGATAEDASKIFDDIRDCLGAVGPPFLPA